jgi:hypothetical protein
MVLAQVRFLRGVQNIIFYAYVHYQEQFAKGKETSIRASHKG